MPTLETRVISGKGLVKLDPSSYDYKKAKIITVYATVVRRATNEYLNFAYNPPRSRYATLVYLRDGYVLKEVPMEFGYQAMDWYPEMSAQTLLAVECAYDGILTSFANLGTALGLTVTGVVDQIKDWTWTNLFFDQIKVVCYADTAIRIVVESKLYDLCTDQVGKEAEPPPPPPPSPPPVAPGTPLQDTDIPLSEPYEGEDDNGDTVPHPIDVVPEPPEFPQGERCVAYRVNYYVNSNTGGNLDGYQDHYGEIEFVGQDPDNPNRLIVTSHGQRITPGSPCYPSPVTYGASSSSAGLNMDTFSYTITPL